jgi:aminocarboxymuconate-semialdehyde decarboxylase
MIIDFHNHAFPKTYLDELATGRYQAAVEKDAHGRLIMALSGDYSIILPSHYDPAARIADMDVAGVDMQVLTFTVPGVHSETAVHGHKLAQIINDGLADMIRQHPTRFTGLAILPLQEPMTAVQELERAVTQLGLRGGTLFTHINGTQLDDPSFLPLYEKAVELDVPLFIHPIIPQHTDNMRDYRLVAVMGFLFETTIAAARLVYSGLLERLPNLKLVLAHMGGTLPFVAERMVRGYEVYEESRAHLSQSPMETLKGFYMDTFPGAPNAVATAVAFAGADKLLMGSDYPHQIGDLAGGVQTIHNTPVSQDEKTLILGQNAAYLLKLTIDK